MEKARQRGLRLEGLNDDDELDDLDRIKQIDIIKSLPVNFQIKKCWGKTKYQHEVFFPIIAIKFMYVVTYKCNVTQWQ